MNESVHGVTKLCDIPDPIEGKKNPTWQVYCLWMVHVNFEGKLIFNYSDYIYCPKLKGACNINQFSCMIKESEWTTWHSVGQLMLSFIHKWINDIICAVHFDEEKWNFIISVWVWKYRETYMSKIEREKNEKITITASLIKMSLAWRSLPFVCMWICTWNPGCYKDLNWAWHGVFRSARSSESTVK